MLERLLDYRADVAVLAEFSRDRRFVAAPYSELTDAEARTYAHFVCLGERRDRPMVRSFFEGIDEQRDLAR
ncbi:hypothetical protein [Roseateles sp. P5_E1]